MSQFQRLGLVPLTLLSRGATAFLGLQQLIEFLPQIIQGGEARRAVLPGCAQLILDEGFALADQLKTLLMVLQPLLEDRARSPQFFGPAIERLGFIDLVAAWIAEAEESVRLALKGPVPVGGRSGAGVGPPGRPVLCCANAPGVDAGHG